MKEFFINKFEYDYYSNKMWCENMLQQEDLLNEYVLNSMSHILNVHHIWNSRLIQKKAESEVWDKLPLSYFEKLHLNNYQTTIDYLEHHELTEKVNYHDSEGVLLKKNNCDILYHILNHSNYHREQISLAMRQLGLLVSSSNFILFK
ncbi:MAG: hypothetical protein HYR91_14810 [Flavobacteriia bacterium]|nr:hypothetical protein [Flavobacteriia bacterium]